MYPEHIRALAHRIGQIGVSRDFIDPWRRQVSARCHHDPMNARRIPLIVAAIGLTLAACGTSDSSSTTEADPEPVATEAAPADDFTESVDTDVAPATDPPTDTGTPNVADAPATETPSATEAPGTAAPATEVPAIDPPPAEPEPAPLGGRTFATQAEPDSQFDGNPFPDLVVDDIGRGGEANIANILPSERPVLLWTWAPH